VLSFLEDAGRCLDPSTEIAGGEARQTRGCCGELLEAARGAGQRSVLPATVLAPLCGASSYAGNILSQYLGE